MIELKRTFTHKYFMLAKKKILKNYRQILYIKLELKHVHCMHKNARKGQKYLTVKGNVKK